MGAEKKNVQTEQKNKENKNNTISKQEKQEENYEETKEGNETAETFDELGEGGDVDGGNGDNEGGDDNNQKNADNKNENDDNDEELDIEELLKKKIKLEDGSEHFIFSRGPKYSDESWPINCHLCRMGNLITDEQIKFHIRGKRHLIRLEKRKPEAKLFSEPFFQCAPKDAKTEIDKQIKIYPGEIISEITPEYEDRIIKPEEFEVKPPSDPEMVKKLSKEPIHDYNEKLPVIGLCYMYKMNGYRGLTYYCTLCSMRISGNAFRHVIGEPHQIKYIIRHFPKFYDKVVDRLSKIRGLDVRYNVRNVFRKLYRKIENAKGFRKMAIVDDDDFFKNLKKYALKTRFDTHYEETTIPITDHEVDVLIRKCINGMEFIRPDYLPDKSQDRRGGGGGVNSGGGGGGGGGGGNAGNSGGGGGGGQEGYRNSNRGRSPPAKRRFTGNDDYGYDWQRYHDLLQREIETLNLEYQEYDRYPASHPRYNIEENKFFNARKRQGHKKEVIRRDWQRIWRQRLREMYDKDLDKRKFRVKRLLRLPFDVRTPSPSPPPRMHRSTTDTSYDYDNRLYADRSGMGGPRDMEALQSTNAASSGPLGVISCLRLLTALEDQLGSLGPKAVQLLSRAVLTEKGGKNPNDLMMENEYYVFFVTAKEKLKGQLFANIIDSAKAGAVTRAVQDCTTLLEMFEDYMRRQGKPMPGYEPSKDTTMMNQYSAMGNQYNSANNGTGGVGNYGGGGSSSGGGNYSGNSGMGGGGSYGNNYSSGSGLGSLSNYSSTSLGGSGSGNLGGGQYRGGNQGNVWQSGGGSYGSGGGGGNNSNNQGYLPIVSYPDRNASRNISTSNMNKW